MTRRRHLSMRPEWEDAIRSGRKTIDARPVADDIADVRTTGGEILHLAAGTRRVYRLRELVAPEQRSVHEFAEHNLAFLLTIRMVHISCREQLRRRHADVKLFGIEPGNGRFDDERILRTSHFERRPPTRFTRGEKHE